MKSLIKKLLREEMKFNDSLEQYNEITKIMVNEYNYKLIELTKDDWGNTTWKLTRNEINDKNKEMNES